MKKSHIFRIAIFSIFIFALSLGVALAEDYSKGILDPAKVLEATREVTTEAYPNADDVLVDDVIWTRYQPDGTDETWDDTFIKVLTEKGRRENATLTFHFTLPYTELDVPIVQIIKPDGTTIDIDTEKQSRIMVDPGQRSSNIYNPNAKVLAIGLAGLEIGDLVRYVSHRKTVKSRVPNTWSDFNVLEYTSPIKRLVIEVHAPKEMPLQEIILKDEVEGTVKYEKTETDKEIIYRWTTTDVPRMYREPGMPNLYSVVQRLLVSTIPDWQELSKWYWNLSKPHLITNPAMEAKVAELIDGKTSRLDQIEAIFYFVSQKVRYMGITTEAEAPGYEPHPATMTFDNRHGVCRDKAALLVTMLRHAGFDAYPVLIHNGPKKDKEVPQPFFNHAIVAVEDPTGGYQLMDMTDENTKEMLPAYLSDKSYLVAKPEGETLRTSAIVPAEENMVFIESQGKVDAKGGLKLDYSIDLKGINDNAYRGYFSRIKPEQRREYFEGVAKRVVPGARLTAFELQPADMLDTSQALSVKMTLEADDILISGEDTSMLPLPILGQSVGMINFILRGTGLEKREFPLVTDYACGVQEDISIDLDPALGHITTMPAYPKVDTDTTLWERKFELTGPSSSTLRGLNRFVLQGVEFTPEQYAGLKDTLKTIEYNNRKMPILRSGDSNLAEADVVIESSEVEYNLADVRNWTMSHKVRKRVLTYNGVKDSGEIQLGYSPVWETVELKYARVINGEQIKNISKEEQNIMDAGWVASAPRYPAAKTLVASLPGVEIGSIIEYEYTRTVKDHHFFATTEVFQSSDPVNTKTVKLTAPAKLKIKTWRSDELPNLDRAIIETSDTADDKQVWTWSVANQPSLKSEPGLPPIWSIAPAVMVSTGSWEDWADEVEDALDDASDQHDAVEEKTEELIKGIRSKRDRAIAIRDFVAINIRSAGPSLPALPLSAVTPADKVLEDAYGNTTDRAVLLHAMLDEAGLDPEFVLASDGPELQILRDLRLSIPDSAQFPVVLVRIEIDKQDIYLNDTSQYAHLGASSFDDKPGLDLGSEKVITIQVPEDAEDRGSSTYEIAFSTVGDARIRVTSYAFGNAFETGKRRYAEMPPEERQRHFQQLVNGISESAKAEGDLTTDFSAYPGVTQFTVVARKYGVRDSDYFYFKIPTSLGSLISLRSDKRERPLYWASGGRGETRTIITLPVGFKDAILSPGDMAWQIPAGAGSVNIEEGLQIKEGTADQSAEVQMVFDHKYQTKPAIIPVADYNELLEMRARLSHQEARTILLEKSAE